MTSSLEQSEAVTLLSVHQTLDFIFPEPQGWDQWPVEAQRSVLIAVLRDALRQVVDPSTVLSYSRPGDWCLEVHGRPRVDGDSEHAYVAGGLVLLPPSGECAD